MYCVISELRGTINYSKLFETFCSGHQHFPCKYFIIDKLARCPYLRARVTAQRSTSAYNSAPAPTVRQAKSESFAARAEESELKYSSVLKPDFMRGATGARIRVRRPSRESSNNRGANQFPSTLSSRVQLHTQVRTRLLYAVSYAHVSRYHWIPKELLAIPIYKIPILYT